MEDKVMLSEIIQKCKEFDEGKSNKEVLDELGSRITVKNYLSIVDKMAILCDFYFSKSSIYNSVEEKLIEFETKKFWKILLKYTNIEIDNKDLCNLDNYDLCFPMIHDYIAQFCYVDYERTCQMISNYIMITCVAMISSYFENMDTESIQEGNKETKELLETLIGNEKLVSELNNLLILNDPNTIEMINEIKKESIKKIKK